MAIPCPAPVKGELLYGYVARLHRLLGYLSPTRTALVLFGSPRGGFSPHVPSGIDAFYRSTAPRFSSSDEVIQAHTLLPYFAVALPKDRQARANECARTGSGRTLRFVLGTPARAGPRIHTLRTCPVCRSRDEIHVGVATWYRVHQIPLVLVCPWHGAALEEVDVRKGSGRVRTFLLPEDVPGTQGPARALASSVQRRLRDLALIADALIEQRLPGKAGFEEAYRGGAEQLGWTTPAGQLRRARIHRAFDRYYRGLDRWFPVAQARRQILRTLRLPHTVSNPVLHHMTLALLVFSRGGGRTRPLATETDARVVVQSLFWLPLRAHAIARLKAQVPLSQVARESGVAVATIVDWANKAGIAYRRRPKRMDANAENLIDTLLAAGTTIREAALRAGVARSTVQNRVGRHPGLRPKR